MVSSTRKKPEIVLFAGPNGSGKSTFTEVLRPVMDYINADEIKKNLKCSDIKAAQIAEHQREECLSKLRDFCFETGSPHRAICICLSGQGMRAILFDATMF